MSTYKNLIIVAMVTATVAGLGAQGRATLVQQRQGVNLAEPWRPANTKGDTKIVGQVIDIRQMPVARASLQLRSLVSGQVQQQTQSDDNGEYEFLVENPGTYIVEMVMLDGLVIALSNAGAVGRFETLQTVVQLPGRWEGLNRGVVRPQRATSYVGMSAATTMTAHTFAIALAQHIRPVDSGEPVSPFRP